MPAESQTENNKAVIRAFLEEVINQGQLDRADALVMENFVELDPLPGTGAAGPLASARII